MGYAGLALTDGRGLAGTSFPEAIGRDDQLFPESEMSTYCFEGIIGQSSAIQKVWSKFGSLRKLIPPSCFTGRLALGRSWWPRHSQPQFPTLS